MRVCCAVDFLFLCDIAVNFRTVYYNEDFELVLDVKAIRKRYMRGSISGSTSPLHACPLLTCTNMHMHMHMHMYLHM